MRYVTSADGTSIAFQRAGEGPPVVLVGGGLDDGSEAAELAARLAGSFTVHTYAKRGTGESGDTPPYAMEREVEDLAALVAAAGGPVHLYGISAGGALALEAVAAGIPVRALAVYEVPYDVAPDAPARARAYFDELDALLAAGRRREALELFMRTAGAPEDDIAGARRSPVWPQLEALAHTLVRGCGSFGNPPAERLARIGCPTLVLTGSAPDPHTRGLPPRFFDDAADAIAAWVPGARRDLVDGQAHLPDPKVLAPVLERFFAAA